MDIMVNKEDKVLISVHRVEAEDDIWEKLDNRRNLTKTAQYETYTSWKRAVKRQFPDAKFHGDKDIDSSFVRGSYYAEWDGVYGTIELLKEDGERMKY